MERAHLHFKVYKVLLKWNEICTSKSTEYCACHEVCASRFASQPLPTRFAARALPKTMSRCLSAAFARDSLRLISENEPHVQKSRFTAPATKSEHAEDHHVQGTAPATKSVHRHKAAPTSCSCHGRSALDHQSMRFPLRLPRRVIAKSENGHRTTTRVQSRRAPARAQQILQTCAAEMHFQDLEVNERTDQTHVLNHYHGRNP